MPCSLNIEIAGVSFSISGANEKTTVTPPSDPAYLHFIEQKPVKRPDIRVTVLPDSAATPDQAGKTRLFDSGRAWSMFRRGDGYLLTLNPFENEPPLWTIVADRDFSKLTANCHRSMVKEKNDRLSIPSPITYPLDQIILIHHLARKDGIIVHAAGLEYAGHASIFPGRSGAGKSSVSTILMAAGGVSLLSDDRIVIRKKDDRFVAYGTPWPGEAKIAANRKSVLGTVFFLTRAKSNRVKPLAPDEALKRLFPVTSIPWYDEKLLPEVLDFCGDLVKSASFFDLQFTLDKQLMDLLADFLPGEDNYH
jgi:hypothetical protein